MKTICLLSCCKEKLPNAAPAEKLYQSDKFKCRLAYARLLNPDSIFVISALHHIVPLDKVLEPYNVCLKDFSVTEKREWAECCWKQLDDFSDREHDNYIIFAGKDYYEELVKGLNNYSIVSYYAVNTKSKTKSASSDSHSANLSKITSFLKESGKNYCDDCISRLADIRRRNQVNQICNKAINIIHRNENSFCSNCGKFKITRSLASL